MNQSSESEAKMKASIASLSASGYVRKDANEGDESWEKVKKFIKTIPNDYKRLVASQKPIVKGLTYLKNKERIMVDAHVYDWTVSVYGHDVSYLIVLPQSPDVKDRAIVTAFYNKKGVSYYRDLTQLDL